MPRRWPLHPPPYSDESLSSWIERLADVYDYRVEDLVQYDLGFAALTAEALDLHPPLLLLERLAERTGMTTERLRMMTVPGWNSLLRADLSANPQRYAWYVGEHAVLYPRSLRLIRAFPAWLPWFSHDRFAQRLGCRRCLTEGPEPYRRLAWRMAWMTSCPQHAILLEDVSMLSGSILLATTEEPVPAPPALVTLDHFTWEAITTGTVVLPRQPITGSLWFQILRTLLEELSVPTPRISCHIRTITTLWHHLGLQTRQGISTVKIPFEQMSYQRQFLLMRVAAVAVEHALAGSLPQPGEDAVLFTAPPLIPLSIPIPDPAPQPPIVTPSAYEHSLNQVHVALQEVEDAMHHHLATAVEIRTFLLGSNPTVTQIAAIDRVFREQGYLLPEDVL